MLCPLDRCAKSKVSVANLELLETRMGYPPQTSEFGN
jgi:hypothetical protein